MRRVILLPLALAACAGAPLTAEFPSSLSERGNCGWEFQAWSAEGDTLLRFRLDPGQWERTALHEVSELTFTYPRSAWTDQEGDLELRTGRDLAGGCAGGVEPAYRYLPFEGLATLSVQPDYYDVDDEGCTVARGLVDVELEGLVLTEASGAADGVVVDTFAVSGDVEILDGCSF